ncbi:chemotaxis protein CheD [Tepidiforma sp.]|jgi:chemotaxis protein CheD|uniref:chemotaxis protein CheD n=1 Tax=Tepidiforma sp. TaxID=2682230 RepID=UPI0021DDC6FD|nr:chemotaxis protein CheD [Tepidiforma sp.]MCX7617137.1 chemotaxis protein CheD [Tepidiforma sp.]GIW17089.1 MAG: chemoreceptor glutamine deamidase CheD [Tepidiforma sp.]
MTTTTAEARRISVGIGQLALSRDPRDVLVAYGLGSCVGISCWDPEAKVAALAHILLPSSEGKRVDDREPARFADSGIDLLLQRLAEAGAVRRRLIVKVAGGAAVLGAANAEKFKIGVRNAEAITERLKHHGIRVAAADLGGTKGRTMELHVATGKTFVRTAASPASEL